MSDDDDQGTDGDVEEEDADDAVHSSVPVQVSTELPDQLQRVLASIGISLRIALLSNSTLQQVHYFSNPMFAVQGSEDRAAIAAAGQPLSPRRSGAGPVKRPVIRISQGSAVPLAQWWMRSPVKQQEQESYSHQHHAHLDPADAAAVPSSSGTKRRGSGLRVWCCEEVAAAHALNAQKRGAGLSVAGAASPSSTVRACVLHLLYHAAALYMLVALWSAVISTVIVTCIVSDTVAQIPFDFVVHCHRVVLESACILVPIGFCQASA
jgi:hypothetical protein